MRYQVRDDGSGRLIVCLPSGAHIAIIPPMGDAKKQLTIAHRIAAVDEMYAALVDIASDDSSDPASIADEALEAAEVPAEGNGNRS